MKIEELQSIIAKSHYLVVLCGSEMLKECEILKFSTSFGEVFHLLSTFQKLASVRSIITNSFFDFPSRAGCKNVIELHGNINRNTCDKCGAVFSGDKLILIHSEPHYLDEQADIFIHAPITDLLHTLNHSLSSGYVRRNGL